MNAVQTIMDNVPIKEGLEFYGIEFNQNGYACCPFHHEKTASFRVYDKHHAKCFGCGWYGSIIDFIKAEYGLEFKQAVFRLDCDFNLGIMGHKPTLTERNEAIQERKVEEARLQFKAAVMKEILALIDRRRKVWKWSIKPGYEALAGTVQELDNEIDWRMEWYNTI